VDSTIFDNTCVFKTAYLFLDSAYFFFYQDKKGLIVQCTLKPETEESAKDILGKFSNELLNTLLREKLAKENKKIRETIMTAAIQHSLREAVFYEDEDVEEDILRSQKGVRETPDMTNTKSIDDILKEIEEELSAEKQQ